MSKIEVSEEFRKVTGRTAFDDAVMIGLSLVSVFLLFFEVVADQTPQQSKLLELADVVIACIFLAEFCYRLVRSPNRGAFMRKHWWELLAAIPITSSTTQVLRALNLLRLVRLLRLLRLLRFLARLKILLEASQRLADQSYLIYISILTSLVIMGGALGFHYMEADVNPNVHSLWDSFWWTVVTVTTVGYGDIYPVTTGGRILAIFLMMGGIATVSTATASIAAHLIRKREG